MKQIQIVTLCVICVATAMSGCVDPAEVVDDIDTMNTTEVKHIAAEVQRLTTEYVDAIDAARDERLDSYGTTFDDWDIKTDELIQSSDADADNLYIEYTSSSMTYETYLAKDDAIWNAFDHQYHLYDRERDRGYERADDTYSNIADELTKEYDICITTIIDALGGE